MPRKGSGAGIAQEVFQLQVCQQKQTSRRQKPGMCKGAIAARIAKENS